VSGDRENRENRESAGKWNDTGKKREMTGNIAKRRKIREFISIILILKKENYEVRFCRFFEEKTKPIF